MQKQYRRTLDLNRHLFTRMMTVAVMTLISAVQMQASAGEQEIATTSDGQTAPQSTFTVPRSLKQGRDPFNPGSTRFIAVIPDPPEEAEGPAKLELKGISGTDTRPLAIINNRTFAEGDEQSVNTPQGRVMVMCLAIEGTTVKVRAQGQTRQLMMRKGL